MRLHASLQVLWADGYNCKILDHRQPPGSQSCDPLLYHAELPFEKTFYPLGFAFRIRTNARTVLEAAEKSFAGFAARSPAPVMEARLLVSGDEARELPAAPVFRAQHNLLTIVSDAANFAACDLAAAFAFGCFTRLVAGDADFLRFHFLEAIAYTLLTQLWVTPLHASCVARAGVGVLLCGPSGAGKSSLAFGCARRGWTLISDNICYLIDETREPHIAGRPQSIRFRETARELFPDLAQVAGRLAANGKMTLEIATRNLAGLATGFECPVGCLIFLERNSGGGAQLTPLPAEESFRRLRQELPAMREEVEQRQRNSLLKLVARPAFELRYAELEAATGALERLVQGS